MTLIHKETGGGNTARLFVIADLKPFLTWEAMTKITLTESGCWQWHGAKNNRGYATIGYKGKTWTGHKLTCHLLGVAIPDGMRGDHQCHTSDCSLGDKCHHRACINPDHIKPATDKENYARSNRLATQRAQTHCSNGHEYTPENTGRKPNGARRCRKCSAIQMQKIRARRGTGSLSGS